MKCKNLSFLGRHFLDMKAMTKYRDIICLNIVYNKKWLFWKSRYYIFWKKIWYDDSDIGNTLERQSDAKEVRTIKEEYNNKVKITR